MLETPQGEAIIDQQIQSLREIGWENIACLTGYHVEKLVQAHSDIDYYYDSDWREHSDVEALSQHSELLSGNVILADSATLFEQAAVASLVEVDADVTVAIQRFPSEEAGKEARRTLATDNLVILKDGWVERVEGEETVPDARLTGLVHLSPRGSAALRSAVRSLPDANGERVPALIDLLDSVSAVDIHRRTVWVADTVRQYDEEYARARFLLGSKADTLERLEKYVEEARFPEQVTFDLETYERSPAIAVDRVRSTFSEGPIVVRSSAVAEDGWHDSQAGAFHTELGVDPQDDQQLTEAIDCVVESLRENSPAPDGTDQILVQKQVEDVAMSGVAFTRELDSGGPYTVVNYDTSGRTDAVTAGHDTHQRTAYFHHGFDATGNVEGECLAAVRRTVDEIRELLDDPPLDIEFAIDANGRVTVLQVRPLAVQTGEHRYDERDVSQEIQSVAEQVEQLGSDRPILLGEGTVLAVMPDWNPAEMIGTDPAPLAASLYEYLITDDVWARARAASGYRDVRPTPLMVKLAGRPYIDTLADFNSFLPASLPNDIGERLVDHYVKRLAEDPGLQDKVEFEVAFTCLDFGFDRRRPQLEAAGFSEDEISTVRFHLRDLTDDIVCGEVASVDEQRERLVRLGERRCELLGNPCTSWSETVRRVKQLLDDTREFGTLPFAILARYAFVATAFLRSLNDRGVLTDAEAENISEGLQTIAGELTRDTQRLSAGDLEAEAFFDRYGHLRPGTYDICSLRYDEAPQRYFDVDMLELDPIAMDRGRGSAVADWSPTISEEAQAVLSDVRDEVATLLDEAGFAFDVEDLYTFVTSAIPLRELAKFEFTRSLSAALTLLRRSAKSDLGIAPEQLACVTLGQLMQPVTENPSPVLHRELERTINYQEKRGAVQQQVELPPVIRNTAEVYSFEVTSEQPNFITNKTTVAPVVRVNEQGDLDRETLNGAIAAIAAADPGYDWIFSCNVAGLVTQFGGVASHMAIRAAEFGLPAAIGCGDIVYEEIIKSEVVELDCNAGRVQRVR
jgi:choline kinase/phosphohistidine swiveling domain-containing protein